MATRPFALAVAGAACMAGSAQAQDISYIPTSSLIEGWTAIPGSDVWADNGWTKTRTTTLEANGDITLGQVGGQEGWMQHPAPAGMSYVNCGMEMTFNGVASTSSNEMFLMLWTNTNPREGFVVTTSGNGTVGASLQMYRDAGASWISEAWDTTPSLVGPHTMALVRYSNGDVRTYVDGVLVGTQTGTTTPFEPLVEIGVGNQYSGGRYLPRGTSVSQVRTFTVSPVAGAVDAAVSTVAPAVPEVWADGSATAKITVTLKDVDGYPVSGKNVTLVTSGSALIAPVGPVLTGADGTAVFTATSGTPSSEVFTATGDAIGITETASVDFVAKPDPVTTYLTGVTLLEDWDFTGSQNPGNWTRSRTTHLTDEGMLLGLTPPPAVDNGSWVGLMRKNVPSGFTYFNHGVEFTYYAPAGPPPTSGFEPLSIWRNSPRTGYTILTNSLTGTPRVKEEEAPSNEVNWDTTPGGAGLAGLHTMALVRYSDGTVESWLDGVLMGTRSSTDPSTDPEFISIGWNVNGNMYMPFNTIVSEVRAFKVTPVTGPVDPANSTVVASADTAWAGDVATTTVTVTLKDAAGLLIEGKEVALSYTGGPGTPNIDPPGISAGNGQVTFLVSSLDPGDYVLTATETTDDPDVVLTQTVSVSFVTPGDVAINVNIDPATRTGLEGPAGGLGETWNQLLAATSINLLDKNGVVTTVGYSLPGGSGPNAWGATLPMIYASRFNHTSGTITGLTPGATYDLYIASFYNNESGSAGDFVTTNATSNGATQAVDNGYVSGDPWGNWPAKNSATWELGNNYVVFKDIVVDGGGAINLAMNKTLKSDASDPRNPYIMFSGFQLVAPSGSGNDYDTWAAGYLPDDVSDPDADFDGDGLTNGQERAFGLDPTSGASLHPITVPLDPAGGTFSYTRRDVALSGLIYTIWTSPDLENWTEDTTASAGQVPGAAVDEVETVAVTLSATPVDGKLFVQVRAN